MRAQLELGVQSHKPRRCNLQMVYDDVEQESEPVHIVNTFQDRIAVFCGEANPLRSYMIVVVTLHALRTDDPFWRVRRFSEQLGCILQT